MTGGGSGGHITPLLAVAHELKKLEPKAKIIYIGQKGDAFNTVPAENPNIDGVKLVRAGKFRRYHGEGLRQLLDIPTVVKNIRDAIWVAVGIWQSFWLLRRLRPSVIFIKGGFVGVPVGLAAAALRIPYVTHDSDALPGLANRIVAPWARKHAVALPKEIYTQYPQSTTVTVGIPLDENYRPLSAKDIADAKMRLDIPGDSRVILVTGGGLGAQRINNAMVACAKELLDRYSNLYILHLSGRANEDSVRQAYSSKLTDSELQRVRTHGFVTNLHLYSAAANVVVTRAGATSIAEFAAQQKACLVVPNPFLTGGHQLKNAVILEKAKAVRIVEESVLKHDDHALMPQLVELLDKPHIAKELGLELFKLDHKDSANELAKLLLSEVNQK